MTPLATPAVTDAKPRQSTDGNDVFDHVAKMMEEMTGIVFPESKSSLVQARISKRVIALRLPGIAEYMQFLETAEGASEREQLVFALTTNVTRFFREPHHFDDLKNDVLPELIGRAANGARVRIWSAGCSSGEEPYTIAMTALAISPNVGSYDFKILATDLDRNVIEKAKKGTYAESALDSIPVEYHRLLITNEGMIEMPESAKQLIAFRELNLLHDWPFVGSFDVIFCRNVVIYFSDELSDKLWNRFVDRLVVGGRLYAGHSERIRAPEAKGLKPFGTSSYEKL